MTYKGYAANVEYSDEDKCFVGRIAGIRDVVGFHGESVAELRAAFEEAVDDYLAMCEKLGKAPNRPYSGHFHLRLDPELHARAAMRAQASGLSLNTWVSSVLAQAAT
jgi:predicted HicB family RNase H-like nuclease